MTGGAISCYICYDLKRKETTMFNGLLIWLGLKEGVSCNICGNFEKDKPNKITEKKRGRPRKVKK